MGLRERIANRKPTVTKQELEAAANSADSKRYRVFLKICERLQNIVDLSEVHCSTYEEVFEQIEINNVDISDIVQHKEYEQFKKQLLSDPCPWCPILGKLPEKVYDFNKEEDMSEYLRLHEGARF